ncbi:hypothetical protein TTHERM_01114130 (macronuclear) [Tetrahymena thermophila SB210]|uniref:Uncharacterized protein n=1 Tax=Tetrahymena thermophila (strain SB210) TaxID=312017 RepID=Q24D38_TETTS|nr:hypothetical protein TTHERM_01114130 [Tetrahymena thermophila SB210]EAS05703.1 hypothetical protein TTHERM_01114130 [Tetrahymena thermophila SB210]|eukprot:XP_001025948.1 hypothetical protein TTHERM_01114130 [Tetrahymena thermophila SB210]
MIYYNSNQSIVYKNSPSLNFQQDNMQGLQQQQSQSLLNNNIFANQALQQYQQKNSPVSALQHSFAQQTNTLQYNQLNLINNNNIDENNNFMLNHIMNNNLLEQQNQENLGLINSNNYHNPLLELSAPKFGRLQETQIQNSWQQNNLQANQEQFQNTGEECKPFSSEQGQESVHSVPDSKDRPPLLFVDVNLGNQRSERIIVNEGDNPKQLAYDFARLHGLDDQTAEKLYQLLENQIAGLLSRIEEEENISHLENLD